MGAPGNRAAFHAARRLETLAGGDRAAVLWRARVSADGGDAARTEVFGLHTLAPDVRRAARVRFAGAALMARRLASPVRLEWGGQSA